MRTNIISRLLVALMLICILITALQTNYLKNRPALAAGGNTTQFMETPDAANNVTGDVNKTFWTSNAGTVTFDTATKISGKGSWKIDSTAGNAAAQLTKGGVLAAAGRRMTFYINFSQLPASEISVATVCTTTCTTTVGTLTIDASGVLRLRTTGNAGAQLGSNGGTLSTARWYRIAISYRITTTTNYSFGVVVNGGSITGINATNSPTLAAATTDSVRLGWINLPGASRVFNFQHLYIDNGTAVDDPGEIWVTAKRPNANGAANAFTTRIGAGGSGYGTGHSPQVNERPISTTNGWQSPGTAGLKVEEYTIESAATGDTNISNDTVVAYTGWIYAARTNGGAQTTNIIVNGVASSISLNTTATLYTVNVDSNTYPSTNTAIGMDQNGTGRQSLLYEAGILIAYTPIISVSISSGSVAYGVLATSTSKDTTASGLNNTQVATNNGDVAEDFSIKGQDSANWTLAGSPGSESYSHYFCTSGSGSPDPCDTGPTWTAMTTSYQFLATNILASGTQRFDLKISTPTSTTATSQQTVNVTILATAH
jgi:hypothetical protein